MSIDGLVDSIAISCIENDGKYQLKMMSDKSTYCPFPNVICPYLNKKKTIVNKKDLWYWGCEYEK